MSTKITLELTEEEAEWMGTCLTLVMQLSRHWDDLTRERIKADMGNGIFAKLTLARVHGKVGMDPDEWLSQAPDWLRDNR
jgi:hypothetical protein